MKVFLDMYENVMKNGRESSPRGLKIKEIENAVIRGIDSRNPFTSFVSRKLNVKYACYEFLWYLRADRFDTSIEKHATLWKKIRDDIDGGFNSNYGQYIYHGQMTRVIDTLVRDPDSRQAVMTLLDQSHLRSGNPDVVCTYSISFRIRRGELNMSVNMRSSDAVYGFTNDVFCFSMVHLHVLNTLRGIAKFKNLALGDFTLKVDSLHIYEKHFEMVNDILKAGKDGYYKIDVPEMTPFDADFMNRFRTFSDVDESPESEFHCLKKDAEREGLEFFPWLVEMSEYGLKVPATVDEIPSGLNGSFGKLPDILNVETLNKSA
ncbi:MAG: thymidylate synthase [Acinetobacter sp.]